MMYQNNQNYIDNTAITMQLHLLWWQRPQWHKSKMAAMWFDDYHIMYRNFGTNEDRNMYNVSKYSGFSAKWSRPTLAFKQYFCLFAAHLGCAEVVRAYEPPSVSK